MRFDVFFSICQNEIDGYKPSEAHMFQNFFEEVQCADELPFETAWIAESHLSSEVQKKNKHPVIPHFNGEVGLNTDITQLAHYVFSKTKRIEIGSAIRNILCNGGPLAHAENIRYFLSLHSLNPEEKRKLHVGFAAGRFDYSNKPYGIYPKDKAEEFAWKYIKPKIFSEALEIFCRAIRGDTFSSEDIAQRYLSAADFKDAKDWETFLEMRRSLDGVYPERSRRARDDGYLKRQWEFETLALVPRETPLHLLSLTLGSHDPQAQKLANTFLPCKVFNLSITPNSVIEATHKRMMNDFHPNGGPWKRDYLPRTVLVFIEDSPQWSEKEQTARAQARARKSLEIYWKAIEGTLNEEHITQAVENSLYGSPEHILEQIRERFHPEDRLMLWFDFNCHDSAYVIRSMRSFAEKVLPFVSEF